MSIDGDTPLPVLMWLLQAAPAEWWITLSVVSALLVAAVVAAVHVALGLIVPAPAPASAEPEPVDVDRTVELPARARRSGSSVVTSFACAADDTIVLRTQDEVRP